MENEMNDLFNKIISVSLLETAAVLREITSGGSGSIISAASLIADSMRFGGKLLLCGNGGSAADCQHMAAEFVCCLSGDRDRPGLPALALTTDTSFLTAYCNDYCFEDVFSRQVLALGRKGDVLMGISTSGSSENIIRAIREANNIGMGTISLSRKGGQSGQYADVAIEVDSNKTAVIQNVHMAVEHVLCYIVEELIFGEHSTADKG